jgi:hypothetical protein
MSETLYIPPSNIKSIIINWKEMAPQQTCQEMVAHQNSQTSKEGINQRGHKDTKDNPEGAAKLHSGHWSICP